MIRVYNIRLCYCLKCKEVTLNLIFQWQDLCDSYIIEAKWFNEGYTPTFDEFINNAHMSIGVVPIIRYAYLLTLTSVTEEELKLIERAENMIRYACTIVRLTNDMGTSSVKFSFHLINILLVLTHLYTNTISNIIKSQIKRYTLQ